MENRIKIQRIVGISVLFALVIVLQVMSNYITFGPVSITLALIPLSMGAILYGPIVGLFLGVVMGAMVLVAPSTGTFLSFNVWFTILLCLVKSGMAGLVSGLLFEGVALIKTKHKRVKLSIGVILAALSAPIINTGIFILGATFMFTNLYSQSGNFGEAFSSAVAVISSANFLVEFLVSAILSPTLIYLVQVLAKRSNLAFSSSLTAILEEDKSTIDYSNIDENNLLK